MKIKDDKDGSESKVGRKNRKGLSVKRISLHLLERRLMNTLARDTAHLLEASLEEGLSRDESAALVNYLKLLKQLKSDSAKEADSISNEELERLAKPQSE